MSAFDKIIGYNTLKKELMLICDTIRDAGPYRKLGAAAPRGLLLHGEPGLGKSLMASAIIQESGRVTFTCRKDKPDGDFVNEIKATFDRAIENAPSIVFLDDMDKFSNGDEDHPDAEEYVTVQSCIDAAKGHEVFVLATANNIRCLPYSLRRAGRFDRVIKVEPPTGKDAELIIAHYLEGKKFVGDIDPRTIARLLDGRSCAELETIINTAGLYAGYQRSEVITMEHFMTACMATVFGVPEDDDDDDWDYSGEALNESDGMLRQIILHEAGHAVISEVLCPESVTLISARGSNGRSTGGFTHYYNDHRCTSEYWLKSRAVGALGGMAALEQVCGTRDFGSNADLESAFKIANGQVRDACILGYQLYANGYGDSPSLRANQEQAAVTLVEQYFRKAKEIIALNREFYDKLAAALAEKGLLFMAEVQEIKAGCTITPVTL